MLTNVCEDGVVHHVWNRVRVRPLPAGAGPDVSPIALC